MPPQRTEPDRAPPRVRSKGRGAVLVALIALAWIVGITIGGRWLIPAVYHQTLPLPLVDFIEGASANPLEHYVSMWDRLMWNAFPAVVLFSVIALYPVRPAAAAVVTLAIAAWVPLPGLLSRAACCDEAYTLLETAGHAPPEWPTRPAPAASVKYLYDGAASFSYINTVLHEIDIHPPLYYWGASVWRGLFGFSVQATRGFSAFCSVISVFGLYLLLRAGGMRNAFIPTLVYGMTAWAVHFAGVARNYSAAFCFVVLGALFAYLSVAAVRERRPRAIAYGIAAAFSCGAAFQTHYFALFAVGAVLLWMMVHLWSSSRVLAVLAPALSAAIALIDAPRLIHQLGARANQGSEFLGYGRSVKALLQANLQLFWQPMITQTFFVTVMGVAVAVVGLALIAITAYWVATRGQREDRRLWTLLFGYALAPTVGVLVIESLTSKNLHSPQYISFAMPALAAVVAFPIARLWSTRPRPAACLLGVVFVLQMLCVNWGVEAGPVQMHTKYRSAADAIARSATTSQIVLIDSGCSDVLAGCGFQLAGLVVYELHPRTNIVMFGDDANLEYLMSLIRSHHDVWVQFAVAGVNRGEEARRYGITPLADSDIRKRLLRSLRSSPCYVLDLMPGVEPELYHVNKQPAACDENEA